jgi:hypothetical protein
MSSVGEQTKWLMESLPKCANVYKASVAGWPTWVVVRLNVPPAEAEPGDMKATFWKESTRSKALVMSKDLATTEDPRATDKEHRGVWRIEKDGVVTWQTVWPFGF